jgi:hypothetical protein
VVAKFIRLVFVCLRAFAMEKVVAGPALGPLRIFFCF